MNKWKHLLVFKSSISVWCTFFVNSAIKIRLHECSKYRKSELFEMEPSLGLIKIEKALVVWLISKLSLRLAWILAALCVILNAFLPSSRFRELEFELLNDSKLLLFLSLNSDWVQNDLKFSRVSFSFSQSGRQMNRILFATNRQTRKTKLQN